jgi:uncharacterized membrane-anchored protein YitT (DUF2179 family)
MMSIMNQIKTITPTPGPFKRIALVLAGALLTTINLNTFVHTANLFPGGFSGLALLIKRSLYIFRALTVPYSVLYLTFNIFPVYISFRYIGKKFTLYSLLMIVVSSILADILPSFNVTDDVLLCSVFGGLLSGLSTTLCLSADATSGGTDFVAIYFSEKHGKDMWNYIFAGNCCILGAAGLLFGWKSALYSIIFQFTATQVLNMLYRRYQKTTLLIVTDNPDKLYTVIHEKTNHDATLFQGTGCYKKSEKSLLYTVISGDEVHKLSQELHKADPAAFINVLQSKGILGNFFIRPNN